LKNVTWKKQNLKVIVSKVYLKKNFFQQVKICLNSIFIFEWKFFLVLGFDLVVVFILSIANWDKISNQIIKIKKIKEKVKK